MGFNVSLITIEGKSPETIHADFGVILTGEREEIPESPITGIFLPSGKYALWLNTRATGPASEKDLAILSRDASVLVCDLSETTMDISLVAWENGQETWSVWHDGGRKASSIWNCTATFQTRSSRFGSDFLANIRRKGTPTTSSISRWNCSWLSVDSVTIRIWT